MRHILLSAAALSALSACAITPEPCTRDYFVYQADVFQRDFARRNRGEVRRLRILRDDLREQRADVFTALAIVSAKQDLEVVVADVRDRVIPNARAIATRCGIDEAFDIMMDGFLAEQGVDPELVRALNLFELFEDPALQSTLEPAT
ncbi:MAG: hypothetical protein AAF830_12425 [Pseudomonadota bacterium]